MKTTIVLSILAIFLVAACTQAPTDKFFIDPPTREMPEDMDEAVLSDETTDTTPLVNESENETEIDDSVLTTGRPGYVELSFHRDGSFRKALPEGSTVIHQDELGNVTIEVLIVTEEEAFLRINGEDVRLGEDEDAPIAGGWLFVHGLYEGR